MRRVGPIVGTLRFVLRDGLGTRNWALALELPGGRSSAALAPEAPWNTEMACVGTAKRACTGPSQRYGPSMQ